MGDWENVSAECHFSGLQIDAARELSLSLDRLCHILRHSLVLLEPGSWSGEKHQIKHHNYYIHVCSGGDVPP